MTDLAQRDVFRMPSAPTLPTGAVERLPRGELGVDELDADPFWRLVAAFLVECRRAQTRRAYFTDLKAWYAWCAARDLHPLAARRHDVALRRLNEASTAGAPTATVVGRVVAITTAGRKRELANDNPGWRPRSRRPCSLRNQPSWAPRSPCMDILATVIGARYPGGRISRASWVWNHVLGCPRCVAVCARDSCFYFPILRASR